ncbi:hypothetical protein EYC84_011129 [Monilinia fructicola]|uniref:UBC core domain-containing protein n=1 Tax=Monilinia fructicola TaxID=38448 RepID=A0A5M9J8L6_MONFR|nr:hypothetical protein EYC84_011129 [Monilinia fructicola]
MTDNTLHRRLLLDIAELQAKPYPNITLHVDDENIYSACLILAVEGYGHLHMTVEFPPDYPLQPPSIEMNTAISHPNVRGKQICASLLNTMEGWTSAYTLKGIAIQLLSFFASDEVEQVDGNGRVNLQAYRNESPSPGEAKKFICAKCSDKEASEDSAVPISDASLTTGIEIMDLQDIASQNSNNNSKGIIQRMKLPDEVILSLCENLETEDLMLFARAWSRVSRMITQYDLIRTRELQCFFCKQDYKTVRLGVGVRVDKKETGKGIFSSEFDLLSYDGFWTHSVRRSVQGIKFQYWLPLPISEGHWKRIKLPKSVYWHLDLIRAAARLGSIPQFKVIYHFMNDVVVKLNKETEENTYRAPYYPHEEMPRSTLTHGSEKAIESYFHLFHLLVCLAAEDKSIVKSANDMLKEFIDGETSEKSCPNLGHLLVASLISDIEISNSVMEAIIKETITRNVENIRGWKPLSQLANEAFQRHGAPPRGSAKHLANCIRGIHLIDSFSDFFDAMGMGARGDDWFTHLLRECIRDSINKGYSKMPITQSQALYLRQLNEPGVEVAGGLQPAYIDMCEVGSFFPESGSDL